MDRPEFKDYYEILQVNQSDNLETIERKFRELALKYHPDNPKTGDRSRFDVILEANNALKDPKIRSVYDNTYSNYRTIDPTPPEGGGDLDENDVGRDIIIQNKLLLMLYAKRRESVRHPGISNAAMEKMTGCTYDALEFQLWYLKEKGWISRGDDGLFAITIDGIDWVSALYQEERAKKRITHQG